MIETSYLRNEQVPLDINFEAQQMKIGITGIAVPPNKQLQLTCQPVLALQEKSKASASLPRS